MDHQSYVDIVCETMNMIDDSKHIGILKSIEKKLNIIEMQFIGIVHDNNSIANIENIQSYDPRPVCSSRIYEMYINDIRNALESNESIDSLL